MTDIFIPKNEKIKIIVEAVIYIFLILFSSYFTICGNLFVRMIPMLYIVGILGFIMFDRPVLTVIFVTISILIFGYVIESRIDVNIFLLAIYSGIMTLIGEVTGHIIKILYDNFKLRIFIKYYNKIAYLFGLILSVLIPLFLNNLVNSNIINYCFANRDIQKYVKSNYAYSEYSIEEVRYIPSYYGGTYEFNAIIDGTEVKLNYNNKKEISDVNMLNRTNSLNEKANAEINILLRKNNLSDLDVKCRYDYSKIATIPDVIKISIENVDESKIDKVVNFIEVIKNWDKINIVERIDVNIDNENVSISKKDIAEKDITKQFILDGMKQEMLDSKGGM